MFAIAAILGSLFAVPTPILAWSPETRARVVRDATRMMPRSLRTLLERHQRQVMRGALDPTADEDSPAHRPPWDRDGTLPSRIEAASDDVVRAVDEQLPFAEVARRFGELAHFVADAGFPPNAGANGDADRYRHFTALVDDRLEKIPFVFYGQSAPDLSVGDRRAFSIEILEEARKEDAELARAYEAAGPDPHPSAFDDRSVPFAVASLSYSQTVTHVVQAWLDAWKRANGDLGRTPYVHQIADAPSGDGR